MTLRLEAALRGNLPQLMRRQERVVARAVSSGVRTVTFGLGRAIRAQIRRARFRNFRRLQRAVIAQTDPKRGADLDIEGRVRSKARYPRSRSRRGNVDLIEVYDTGATIRAQGGRWLAVPTAHAPFANTRGAGSRKASPSETDIPMQFLPTAQADLARLVAAGERRSRGQRPTVLYWLVKSVRVRKRLDIAAAERTWKAKLQPQIARNLDRFARRAGVSV